MSNKINELKQIIVDLHNSVNELSKLFPEKKFTLDGRLVGDIGEVVAEELYEIEIFEKNTPYYDAKAKYADLDIQIKATFKESLTFTHNPDYYIGIKFNKDGSFEEIYNGPGKYIYNEFKERKGIGTKLLSLPITKLRAISNNIPLHEKIKMK